VKKVKERGVVFVDMRVDADRVKVCGEEKGGQREEV